MAIRIGSTRMIEVESLASTCLSNTFASARAIILSAPQRVTVQFQGSISKEMRAEVENNNIEKFAGPLLTAVFVTGL
jgi:hypothetical protein